MSELKGKLVTCDVCGKTVFLKLVSQREADGGFTKWNEYEKASDWKTRHVPIPNETINHICPSCTEHIQHAIEDAVNEIRTTNNEL